MRSLCVSNLKGGVGKTCTVANVASILSKDYGKRVLVSDCDSQCNTTEFLGADPAQGNLADVLRKRRSAESCIQSSNIDGVDILPGSEELMDLDLTKASSTEYGVDLLCLQQLVADLSAMSRYDYYLFDCPPAFNAAFSAALVAADGVIIPIKLDAFSLRGLSNLLRQVANMRKINPRLRVAGCLATMYYKSDDTAKAWNVLSASGLPVFTTRIRYGRKMDEMTYKQQPLVSFSPGCGPCRDYRRFVAELIGGNKNG